MGSRGPIRRVDSIRGEREMKRERRQARPKTVITVPKKPRWLPPEAFPIWENTLDDLLLAEVPVQRIDAAAIGMFCITVHHAQLAANAGDDKMLARLNRDVLQWANAIGGSPAARARLGIKAKAPVESDADAWAQFLK